MITACSASATASARRWFTKAILPGQVDIPEKSNLRAAGLERAKLGDRLELAADAADRIERAELDFSSEAPSDSCVPQPGDPGLPGTYGGEGAYGAGESTGP